MNLHKDAVRLTTMYLQEYSKLKIDTEPSIWETSKFYAHVANANKGKCVDERMVILEVQKLIGELHKEKTDLYNHNQQLIKQLVEYQEKEFEEVC